MAKKKPGETNVERSPPPPEPSEKSEASSVPPERIVARSPSPFTGEFRLSFTSPYANSEDYLAPLEKTPTPVTPLEYNLWPVTTEIVSLITEPEKEKSPKRNHMRFFNSSADLIETAPLLLPPSGISNSFPQYQQESHLGFPEMNNASPQSSIHPPSLSAKINNTAPPAEYKIWPEQERDITRMSEYEPSPADNYLPESPAENLPTEEQPVSFITLSDTPVCKEPIGKGKFSRVYKGTYKQETVAIKVPLDEETEISTYHIQKEHSIYLRLEQIQQQYSPCPHIVSLYGFDSAHIWLLMEWMEKGSLDKVLSIKLPPFLSIGSPNQLMTDILQGTAFLHEHHIIHRDLKPANILLNNQHRAKLADFGVATVITENRDLPPAGDISWMSPEILLAFLNQLLYQPTPKNDMYNIGVISLMLIFWRSEPYQTTQNFERLNRTTQVILDHAFIEDIRSGKHDEMPETMPSELKGMIRQSLDRDPQNRPSAKQLLQTILHHDHQGPPMTQASTSFESTLASLSIRKGNK